jgi:nicotinamidase/pyrazinamidase
MKTLLVVDLQNDFLPGGSLAVPEGDQVVPLANRWMPQFELVVASKDWHPPHHGSFASQHPGHQVGDVIELDGLDQILWPDHCVQGTPGAEFSPSLQTERFDQVFLKGIDPRIDSYSALFDNAHRRSTGLDDYLRQRGADELHIMGLATDYCVKFTVLDALKCGFRVRVLVDGCRGIDQHPGDVQRALQAMRGAGAELVQPLG